MVGEVARAALVIKQGADFELTVEVVDANGAPRTVTGWTAQMQLRTGPRDTADVLDTWTPYLGLTSNQIQVDVPADVTAEYDWVDGYYDLFLIDPNTTTVYCVLEGPVKVDRRVTIVS